MKEKKMAELLTIRLENKDRRVIYEQKDEKLRIENRQTNKGVTLGLPGICARYEEEKEKAIEEVVYYVEQALVAMAEPLPDREFERRLFPVIRSTSFPTNNPEGNKLVTRDHTAETRIYYALDLGQTYRLIDEAFLVEKEISASELDEMARFNLRSLPVEPKKDEVAGNTFYFINYNDGYDASRILNLAFIESIQSNFKGTFACSVPHQDVLILADIVNDQGYDVLAQMAMHFFTAGNIPITSLPFLYEEGQFRPIFIMAKSKPTQEE